MLLSLKQNENNNNFKTRQGWRSGKYIKKYFKKRGFRVEITNPTLINFNLNTKLPDLVFARCELSSFNEEAFNAYLIYFKECEARKIPIINKREFLINSQNKYLSHLTLNKYLIKKFKKDFLNPRTYFTLNHEEAIKIGIKEIKINGSVVLKKIASGRGDGVYLCISKNDLKNKISKFFKKEEGVLIQETIQKEKNIDGGYKDMRIWVCREPKNNKAKIISIYYRNAKKGEFLTNQNKGAHISKIDKYDKKLDKYIEYIMDATGGDVGGIDLVKDDKGRIYFEEINFSFETLESQINLVGDKIWHKVADLIEHKLKTQKTLR